MGTDYAFDDSAWRVVRPREVEFISYPYEWAFGQLKDAALLTLDIQAEALKAGMTLKDASAFNVVFEGAKPVMIDALSFERRAEDEPWVAYRQFCQHFLAPLALMATRDVRFGLLSRDFIDGVPLDLAARLVPGMSRLNMGLAMHIHMHSRGQSKPGEGGPTAASTAKVSTGRLEALIDSLRRSIDGLRWDPPKTGWSAYGETTSYTAEGAESKRVLVERLMAATSGERGLGSGRQHRRVQFPGRRCGPAGHRPRLRVRRGGVVAPRAAQATRNERIAHGHGPDEPEPGARLGAH